MRRFTLTSDKVKGTAEVWFNFDNLLCRVDLVDSEMNYEQIQYLLKTISPTLETFRGLLPSSVQIKEIPFEITLDDFQREYPYSRNFHLLKAMWPKFNKKEQVLIYFRAIDYRKYCERTNAKEKWYTPKIAASWLQKKEYLNDWKNL